MDTIDPNDHPKPLETGDIQQPDNTTAETAALHADLEAIANDADVGGEFHATEDGICPDCGKPASEHEGSGFLSEKLISPEWVLGDEEAKATLVALVEDIEALLAEKFPSVALACTFSIGFYSGRLLIVPKFMHNIADKPVEEQGKLAATLFQGVAALGSQSQGILDEIRERLADATLRSAAKAAMLQVIRDQAAASAKNEQKPELN